MGTSVRKAAPGKGHRSDQDAGFTPRKRRPDGSLEQLICTCHECGRVYEYVRSRGHTKLLCNSCKSGSWASRPDRRELKLALVEVRGGACSICGYRRHLGALTFHHLDPSKKRFEIARGHTRSWDALVAEVRKCVVLCENCHREVHAGIATIPESTRAEIEAFTASIPSRQRRRPGRPVSDPPF
jgi:Zn finger protein HypA/HybF involved in hydrogenase expression